MQGILHKTPASRFLLQRAVVPLLTSLTDCIYLADGLTPLPWWLVAFWKRFSV
jgi:hypothetical protein